MALAMMASTPQADHVSPMSVGRWPKSGAANGPRHPQRGRQVEPRNAYRSFNRIADSAGVRGVRLHDWWPALPYGGRVIVHTADGLGRDGGKPADRQGILALRARQTLVAASGPTCSSSTRAPDVCSTPCVCRPWPCPMAMTTT